jgi:thiosulfate/3-mercaptopyruvate sulfurtransferase
LAFTTLIGTGELAAHLADPQWLAVDCRFQLADDTWGTREYLAAHVKGAVYAHLNTDLSAPLTGTNGRHPLPDPETFIQTCIRLGIESGMQVVVYDQDSGMFASRLWWMLRWMGHDAVALLDGGFRRWLAESRPVDAGNNARRPGRFTGSPRSEMTVGASDVAALLGQREALLLDARAPERYRGDIEPIDRVPGHIPGAVNHHFHDNLTDQAVFRAPEALRRGFTGVLHATPPERVIHYCGSGVTACHNVFAMELAGLTGSKLYAGSWSEWSSDPSRPIERAPKEKGPAL